MNEPTDFPATTARGARIGGGAGLAAGLAGIVASSCCVLPIVFVGFGLGGVAAAVIPALAVLRPYLLAAALLAVVFGWASYFRGRRASSAGTACEANAWQQRMPLWLGLASAIVLLALVWQPLIEPRLLPWVR